MKRLPSLRHFVSELLGQITAGYKENKLLKETTWSFLAKGSASICFVALNILLARLLGLEKFGVWSFFYSIISIIALISYFGLNASSRKYIAQYNDTNELADVLKTSLRLRIIFSFCFSTFLLIAYKPLASLFGRPELDFLFLAAVPFVFFSGLVEYFKDVFQGLHRLKYNFFITTAEYSLKLLITFTVFAFTSNIVSIVYSFAFSLFAASAIGSYFFYRFYNRVKGTTNQKFAISILKYSVPLFFVMIGFAVATEIDTVMLGYLSTNSEVGIYSVAKQLIVKLPHISFAIALGSMPVFAKLNDQNREELNKLFNRLMKTNTILFGSIGTLILATSWFFIPLLFGRQYIDSVVPLMILVVFLICYSYSIFLSYFLNYQGKATRQAINLSLTIALNVGLNFILIPNYGASGAAMATSISYGPYILLNWLEVRRTLRGYDSVREVKVGSQAI